MNTDKIAIDVVLIPPEEVIHLAIGINKDFPENIKENYILDAETCIPHITLLMGLVEKGQLPEVNQKLSILTGEFPPLSSELPK